MSKDLEKSFEFDLYYYEFDIFYLNYIEVHYYILNHPC